METIKSILICLCFLMFESCNSQTQKQKNDMHLGNLESKSHLNADSLHKPQVKINVNKKYDEKGRIIKLDSTYSYFYSSPKGASQINNDSIYNNFRSFFNKTHPGFLSRQQENVFFNDSLFKYDFFNDDYFQKRFELNRKMFESMYKEMDSLKSNFLKQTYPNGVQKKKTI